MPLCTRSVFSVCPLTGPRSQDARYCEPAQPQTLVSPAILPGKQRILEGSECARGARNVPHCDQGDPRIHAAQQSAQRPTAMNDVNTRGHGNPALSRLLCKSKMRVCLKAKRKLGGVWASLVSLTGRGEVQGGGQWRSRLPGTRRNGVRFGPEWRAPLRLPSEDGRDPSWGQKCGGGGGETLGSEVQVLGSEGSWSWV